MALNNPWVGYVDRTYQQIKSNVLTKLQNLVPEITDHTESNLFVRMLGIWSALIEMLGYYLDNAARESHLLTARLFRSGVKIAKAYDYRVQAHTPSTGDVTFILSTLAGVDILVPAGTEVQNAEGVQFFTTTNMTILAGVIEGTVGVRQAVTVPSTNIGTSDGLMNQEFSLVGSVVDGTVALTVAVATWKPRETLGYSIGTDTDFVQSVNIDKEVIVIFGDGTAGAIPFNGAAIDAIYQTTLGELGNTGAFTLTNIISSISLPVGITISVENRLRTSGGRGVETLEELKRHIPKSLRTALRAVTELDFIDIPELKAGVAKAGVIFDCGKGVDVYIVPDGGGVASSILISETRDFLEDFRLLLVDITVFSAGEVRFVIVMDLTVLPQFSRTTTENLVKTNLTEFLSFANQEISGAVYISDLYEIIENTEGVDNSNITSLKALPFARILQGTNALNWTRETEDTNQSTKVWKITIVSATTYELFEGNTFLGTLTIGVTINRPEIEFVVLASSYIVGDSWEFYTYPSLVTQSSGFINIIEPSLPVALTGDISINATGGV